MSLGDDADRSKNLAVFEKLTRAFEAKSKFQQFDPIHTKAFKTVVTYSF